MLIGGILLLIGISSSLFVLIKWISNGFGNLALNNAILSIVGLTIIVMGIQTIFSSFLLSIFKMEKE